MNAYVLPIDQITAQDDVGGKAHALARLARAHFPVLPGFALTASAFEDHLRAADIDTATWGANLTTSGKHARNRILQTPVSAPLAQRIGMARHAYIPAGQTIVRSSARSEDSGAHAFAGKLHSIADVLGNEADATARCWASYFSEEALGYAQRRGLLEHYLARPRMGVLIQQQIRPNYSAIVFSRHPVTGKGVLVEFARGGCAQLAQGETTPNSYVLSAETGAVLEARIIDAELPPHQIRDIFDITCAAIELFSCPQDLELGLLNGRLSVFQSRPITKIQSASAGSTCARGL